MTRWNLVLIVLKVGRSQIKVSVAAVSAEGPVPGSQTDVCFLCPHIAEGMWGFCGISWATNSIPEGPSPLDLITSQRFHLPRDLPDSEIEPVSLVSPALASGFFNHPTAWERGHSCCWSRGQQITDLGPDPFPTSFYTFLSGPSHAS